jgi:Arc-like DNA binding domain
MPPQFNITLGDELRDKLDHACRVSSRSVAEEIRQRLVASFELEKDPHTWDFLQDLLLLAAEVKLDIGEDWRANERTRAVFAAAIADQIQSYRAPGEPGRKDVASDATEAPEITIGRAIARGFRRATKRYARSEEGLELHRHLQKLKRRKENKQ